MDKPTHTARIHSKKKSTILDADIGCILTDYSFGDDYDIF
jgi:hypothetical protein